MPPLESFPPVVDPNTHTLILGSMPGKKSLADQQYYAHPRNAFWHIMGELIGAELHLAYEQRLAILRQHGFGLWDVIGCCTRSGSLDADIVEQSITANDFGTLLAMCPKISRIFFNGAKAEQSFARYVIPIIADSLPGIKLRRLTSTSPANARYSIQDKTEIWRKQLIQTGTASP